jgi:hypothetical protein
MALNCHVYEKIIDPRCAYSDRMALLLKEDRAPNPVNVGRFGGIAVVLQAKSGAHFTYSARLIGS